VLKELEAMLDVVEAMPREPAKRELHLPLISFFNLALEENMPQLKRCSSYSCNNK
jgi:hypothetical protein